MTYIYKTTLTGPNIESLKQRIANSGIECLNMIDSMTLAKMLFKISSDKYGESSIVDISNGIVNSCGDQNITFGKIVSSRLYLGEIWNFLTDFGVTAVIRKVPGKNNGKNTVMISIRYEHTVTNVETGAASLCMTERPLIEYNSDQIKIYRLEDSEHFPKVPGQPKMEYRKEGEQNAQTDVQPSDGGSGSDQPGADAVPSNEGRSPDEPSAHGSDGNAEGESGGEGQQPVGDDEPGLTQVDDLEEEAEEAAASEIAAQSAAAIGAIADYISEGKIKEAEAIIERYNELNPSDKLSVFSGLDVPKAITSEFIAQETDIGFLFDLKAIITNIDENEALTDEEKLQLCVEVNKKMQSIPEEVRGGIFATNYPQEAKELAHTFANVVNKLKSNLAKKEEKPSEPEQPSAESESEAPSAEELTAGDGVEVSDGVESNEGTETSSDEIVTVDDWQFKFVADMSEKNFDPSKNYFEYCSATKKMNYLKIDGALDWSELANDPNVAVYELIGEEANKVVNETKRLKKEEEEAQMQEAEAKEVEKEMKSDKGEEAVKTDYVDLYNPEIRNAILNWMFNSINPSANHVHTFLDDYHYEQKTQSFLATKSYPTESDVVFDNLIYAVVRMENGKFWKIAAAHRDFGLEDESWCATHHIKGRWVDLADIYESTPRYDRGYRRGYRG